jgi:hypothetical protein
MKSLNINRSSGNSGRAIFEKYNVSTISNYFKELFVGIFQEVGDMLMMGHVCILRLKKQ